MKEPETRRGKACHAVFFPIDNSLNWFSDEDIRKWVIKTIADEEEFDEQEADSSQESASEGEPVTPVTTDDDNDDEAQDEPEQRDPERSPPAKKTRKQKASTAGMHSYIPILNIHCLYLPSLFFIFISFQT